MFFIELKIIRGLGDDMANAVTPDILRILCITDVMNELAKAASNRQAVALDELMYD